MSTAPTATVLQNLFSRPVTRDEIFNAVIATGWQQQHTVQCFSEMVKTNPDEGYFGKLTTAKTYRIASHIITHALDHFVKHGIDSKYEYFTHCSVLDICTLVEANLVARLVKQFCPEWSVRLSWPSNRPELFSEIPDVVVQFPAQFTCRRRNRSLLP